MPCWPIRHRHRHRRRSRCGPSRSGRLRKNPVAGVRLHGPSSRKPAMQSLGLSAQRSSVSAARRAWPARAAPQVGNRPSRAAPARGPAGCACGGGCPRCGVRGAQPLQATAGTASVARAPAAVASASLAVALAPEPLALTDVSSRGPIIQRQALPDAASGGAASTDADTAAVAQDTAGTSGGVPADSDESWMQSCGAGEINGQVQMCCFRLPSDQDDPCWRVFVDADEACQTKRPGDPRAGEICKGIANFAMCRCLGAPRCKCGGLV